MSRCSYPAVPTRRHVATDLTKILLLIFVERCGHARPCSSGDVRSRTTVENGSRRMDGWKMFFQIHRHSENPID